MDKAELEKLAERHLVKAQKALDNYQETGMQRYYREYEKNDELGEALYAAANAVDEHEKLRVIKADLMQLCRKAENGEDIRGELLAVGEMYGYKSSEFVQKKLSGCVTCAYIPEVG